jgi:tRNA(Ile2)-agmatinylcytidine synthase
MRSRFLTFHIGIDDTDSAEGMCTTFLTYELIQTLSRAKKKTTLIDYPNLVRLNPNIPWRTRGNGALVLRIETELTSGELYSKCKTLVDKFATSKRANAGLVIYEGEDIPKEVTQFSWRAMYSVLSVKEAKALIVSSSMMSYALRSEQGLVGALAGIGNQLKNDFTFELIAYRRNLSFPRKVNKEKVKRMQLLTYPLTFNSYDEENDRVLIAPHGKDPVLLGIRGETPSALKKAFEILLPLENLLGYAIFRTNQGTGEHLVETVDLGNAKSYFSGKVTGKVISKPMMQIGGHAFFKIGNSRGEMNCACYEPTGKLRSIVMALIPGDEIEVGGGVRKPTILHSKVLNLEYVKVLKLVNDVRYDNPKCRCGATMSSEGKDKGFQCRRCGRKSFSNAKVERIVARKLEENQLYLPDLKAHRHLTKPKQRFYFDRRRALPLPLVKNWIKGRTYSKS